MVELTTHRLRHSILSTRREPGDQIPHSVLPLTEGGQLNIMIVYYTLVTDTAVYRFQINQDQDQARVTRWILKGNKGAHASTSMTTEGARKLVRQLQAK